MPDKPMHYWEFELLKDAIEDAMDDLESLQAVYRGQTGVDYIRPLRLAARKRREAPEPSIRERIGRIQTEIEAIDAQAGDAPDEFTNCIECVARDCEEMLLQIEQYEERVEAEDRRVYGGLRDSWNGIIEHTEHVLTGMPGALAVETVFQETGTEGR